MGYEVGVRINIDVLNAQSQVYQTERDLANARYQMLLGQLKLKQAAGVLSDDDLRSIDSLTLPAPVVQKTTPQTPAVPAQPLAHQRKAR